MLHSTAHWQKTIHGYSGMRPPLHTGLYDEMTTFPDDDSVIGLTAVGVNRVIVHTDWYPAGEWATAEARFARYHQWLTLEHAEGAGRVYILSRPPEETLLRGRFDGFAAAIARGDAHAAASFSLEGAAVATAGAPATLEAGELRIHGTEGLIEGRFRSSAGRSARLFVQKWTLRDGQWLLAEHALIPE
jgi:hypothetical protein